MGKGGYCTWCREFDRNMTALVGFSILRVVLVLISRGSSKLPPCSKLYSSTPSPATKQNTLRPGESSCAVWACFKQSLSASRSFLPLSLFLLVRFYTIIRVTHTCPHPTLRSTVIHAHAHPPHTHPCSRQT